MKSGSPRGDEEISLVLVQPRRLPVPYLGLNPELLLLSVVVVGVVEVVLVVWVVARLVKLGDCDV